MSNVNEKQQQAIRTWAKNAKEPDSFALGGGWFIVIGPRTGGFKLKDHEGRLLSLSKELEALVRKPRTKRQPRPTGGVFDGSGILGSPTPGEGGLISRAITGSYYKRRTKQYAAEGWRIASKSPEKTKLEQKRALEAIRSKPPRKCALCDEPWPEVFEVPDEEWKTYVSPELQDKVLCRKCYDELKEAALD